LSPYLFSRYILSILTVVNSSNIVCNIGGLFLSLLAYADDMVPMTQSWDALQKLLNLIGVCCSEFDISCMYMHDDQS
jgi:hypothetical protein